MSEQEPPTARPFVFTVIEDDGVNVTIEVSEKDYQADLAAGVDEEATMKPGRYNMKPCGYMARHPEFKLEDKKRAKCRGVSGPPARNELGSGIQISD